jgi:hypothetical protein
LLGAQEISQQGANDQLEMTFSPQKFSEMSAGEFLREKAFCCFPPLIILHLQPPQSQRINLNQLQSIRNDQAANKLENRKLKNPKPTLELQWIANPGSGEGVLINY